MSIRNKSAENEPSENVTLFETFGNAGDDVSIYLDQEHTRAISAALDQAGLYVYDDGRIVGSNRMEHCTNFNVGLETGQFPDLLTSDSGSPFAINYEQVEVPNPSTTMQVSPDDQEVCYSLIKDDGSVVGEYILICPKIWDQATLVDYLVQQVSCDPTYRGNITIEIKTPLMMDQQPLDYRIQAPVVKQTKANQLDLQSIVTTPAQDRLKPSKKLPTCSNDRLKKVCKKSSAPRKENPNFKSQMYLPEQAHQTQFISELPPPLTSEQTMTKPTFVNSPSFIPNMNLSTFFPKFELPDKTESNQTNYQNNTQFERLSSGANLPKRQTASSATQINKDPDYPAPMLTQNDSEGSDSHTWNQWQPTPTSQMNWSANNSNNYLIPRSSTSVESLPAQIPNSRLSLDSDKQFNQGASSMGHLISNSNHASSLPDSRKTIMVVRKDPARFHLNNLKQMQPNDKIQTQWAKVSNNQQTVFKNYNTSVSHLTTEGKPNDSPTNLDKKTTSIIASTNQFDQQVKQDQGGVKVNSTEASSPEDGFSSSSVKLEINKIESDEENRIKNSVIGKNCSTSAQCLDTNLTTDPNRAKISSFAQSSNVRAPNQYQSNDSKMFPSQATTLKILDQCPAALQVFPEQVKIGYVATPKFESIQQSTILPQTGFLSQNAADLNPKSVPEPRQQSQDQTNQQVFTGQRPRHEQVTQQPKPLEQQQSKNDDILQHQKSSAKLDKLQGLTKQVPSGIQGEQRDFENVCQSIQPTLSSTVAKVGSVKSEMVLRCDYCRNFSLLLSNATWETVLNHIMPIANQELQTLFYTDLTKFFIRCTHLNVDGENSEFSGVHISLSHSLLCRKTKKEFFVNHLSRQSVLDLVLYVSKAHSERLLDSVTCIFCSTSFTLADLTKHISNSVDTIYTKLQIFAGAVCANTCTSLLDQGPCNSCNESEIPDFRFPCCAKHTDKSACVRKLEASLSCLRGGVIMKTDPREECAICEKEYLVHCHEYSSTSCQLPALDGSISPAPVLAKWFLCNNCHRKLFQIVQVEQYVANKASSYKLQQREQLASCLRIIFGQANAICEAGQSLVYSIHQNTSSVNSTVHAIRLPNDLAYSKDPNSTNTSAYSSLKVFFVCDCCMFTADLTPLISTPSNELQKNILILMVLAHIVPHSTSLISLISQLAFKQLFTIRFEFWSHMTTSSNTGQRMLILTMIKKFEAKTTEAAFGHLEHNSSIDPDASEKGEPPQEENVPTVVIENDRRKMTSNILEVCRIPELHESNCYSDSDDEICFIFSKEKIEKFIQEVMGRFSVWSQVGCASGLLGLQAQCRLCTRVASPDVRLKTDEIETDRNQFGRIELCEICVQAITDVCLPSKAETMDQGDICILLEVCQKVGYRLSAPPLCSPKWISLKAVNQILTIIQSFEKTQVEVEQFKMRISDEFSRHLLEIVDQSTQKHPLTANESAYSGFTITDELLAGRLPVTSPKVGIAIHQSRNSIVQFFEDFKVSGTNSPISPPLFEGTQSNPNTSADTLCSPNKSTSVQRDQIICNDVIQNQLSFDTATQSIPILCNAAKPSKLLPDLPEKRATSSKFGQSHPIISLTAKSGPTLAKQNLIDSKVSPSRFSNMENLPKFELTKMQQKKLSELNLSASNLHGPMTSTPNNVGKKVFAPLSPSSINKFTDQSRKSVGNPSTTLLESKASQSFKTKINLPKNVGSFESPSVVGKRGFAEILITPIRHVTFGISENAVGDEKTKENSSKPDMSKQDVLKGTETSALNFTDNEDDDDFEYFYPTFPKQEKRKEVAAIQASQKQEKDEDSTGSPDGSQCSDVVKSEMSSNTSLDITKFNSRTINSNNSLPTVDNDTLNGTKYKTLPTFIDSLNKTSSNSLDVTKFKSITINNSLPTINDCLNMTNNNNRTIPAVNNSLDVTKFNSITINSNNSLPTMNDSLNMTSNTTRTTNSNNLTSLKNESMDITTYNNRTTINCINILPTLKNKNLNMANNSNRMSDDSTPILNQKENTKKPESVQQPQSSGSKRRGRPSKSCSETRQLVKVEAQMPTLNTEDPAKESSEDSDVEVIEIKKARFEPAPSKKKSNAQPAKSQKQLPIMTMNLRRSIRSRKPNQLID